MSGICTSGSHVFAWGSSSTGIGEVPRGLRCACGRYTREGLDDLTARPAAAEAALAVAQLTTERLVTALRDVTNELQAWHDERPDPPGLRDLCVTCGYLDEARTELARAEAAP